METQLTLLLSHFIKKGTRLKLEKWRHDKYRTFNLHLDLFLYLSLFLFATSFFCRFFFLSLQMRFWLTGGHERAQPSSNKETFSGLTNNVEYEREKNLI